MKLKEPTRDKTTDEWLIGSHKFNKTAVVKSSEPSKSQVSVAVHTARWHALARRAPCAWSTERQLFVRGRYTENNSGAWCFRGAPSI
jgi:hypothetical protein